MSLRVNIGCGQHFAPPPWINVDQYAGVEPDIVARADFLPFDDASVDCVYCGHVLEHLEYDTELPATLREIHRVLTPGGYVLFVGPDYDRALANPEWHPLLPLIIRGGDRWPGDRHLWLSTLPRALDAVSAIFPEAVEVEPAMAKNFRWPVVDGVGWQFGIMARKEPTVNSAVPASQSESTRHLWPPSTSLSAAEARRRPAWAGTTDDEDPRVERAIPSPKETR